VQLKFGKDNTFQTLSKAATSVLKSLQKMQSSSRKHYRKSLKSCEGKWSLEKEEGRKSCEGKWSLENFLNPSA
jgi:hypothetical protein